MLKMEMPLIGRTARLEKLLIGAPPLSSITIIRSAAGLHSVAPRASAISKASSRNAPMVGMNRTVDILAEDEIPELGIVILGLIAG